VSWQEAELPTHYPKTKIHPLPSSTPTTPVHHIAVLPQRCNYSDAVPHLPERRVSLMLSQCNTQTILPWGMNSVSDVSTNVQWLSGLMHPWEPLVLVLVCLRKRSSIIAPPSIVGRRVLSSEKRFIEQLHIHTLGVLCCGLCRLCPVVKTMSLTCGKQHRRRVALEKGLPFGAHTEWYWVVVAVWRSLEPKRWTSRHTPVCDSEAKVKPQPAQKEGDLGKTRRWGELLEVCVCLRLSATYHPPDYPRYTTNNHWCSLDTHSLDGVGRMSLIIFII